MGKIKTDLSKEEWHAHTVIELSMAAFKGGLTFFESLLILSSIMLHLFFTLGITAQSSVIVPIIINWVQIYIPL